MASDHDEVDLPSLYNKHFPPKPTRTTVCGICTAPENICERCSQNPELPVLVPNPPRDKTLALLFAVLGWAVIVFFIYVAIVYMGWLTP